MMADHAEDQEMEAEALAAIFDTAFVILQGDVSPFQWSVTVYPETGDPDEVDDLNNVGCKLICTIPLDYPESLPDLQVEIIKGLADDHRELLRSMATQEAKANEGVPSIFAVVERIREWLAENNVKGLDDVSMHAQMMRKQQDAVKKEQRAQASFESQKEQDQFSEAETEELAVRKRRAEGTPCNLDNFLAWKELFDREMEQVHDDQENIDEDNKASKKKATKDEKAGRFTGFQQFSDKTSNLEAIEAAAEQAENDETAMEELEDVNEELFEDDDDLDDLDFDDDEEFLDI